MISAQEKVKEIMKKAPNKELNPDECVAPVSYTHLLCEFKLTEGPFKKIDSKYYLPGYFHFDYLFKVTNNPDYYNHLPMQSNQQIIKEVLADFKSYFKGIKAYKKNPESFTGKPKFPGYCKSERISFDITNQDCVVKTIK